MKIPTYRDHATTRGDQTMTPMIDIVFLLLIFFVCASVGQVQESVLPTDLAAGSLESPRPEEAVQPLGEVWLRLRQQPDGTTSVEVEQQEYTDFDRLAATLEQLAGVAPEIPVILDIAPTVPLEAMIRVYDTCRGAGFESIHFAAEAAALNRTTGATGNEK